MAVQTVTVVGGALAGLRCAEALRRYGLTGPITVFAGEGPDAHDRPPLSKGYLMGEVAESVVRLGPNLAHELDWRAGVRARSFRLSNRQLSTDDGEQRDVDGLVIATGLRPRQLPSLAAELGGVHMLRGLADAAALRNDLGAAPSVAVIGSGFIGTENASTCRTLGLDVTVIALEPPLSRVLGPHAEAYGRRMQQEGVQMRIGAGVSGAMWTDAPSGPRVTALNLDSGERIASDVVVVAVGGAPEVGWLAGSGIAVEDGVLCDPAGLVEGAERVVAAGDVARCYRPLLGAPARIEHWTNAADQAVAAAAGLLGMPGPPPTTPSFWTDQFGARIQGVGMPAHADTHTLVDGDIESGRFTIEAYRADRLIGAVVAGGPRALLGYRQELMATVTA